MVKFFMSWMWWMSTSFISSITMDRFLTSISSRTFSSTFCCLSVSARLSRRRTVLFRFCKRQEGEEGRKRRKERSGGTEPGRCLRPSKSAESSAVEVLPCVHICLSTHELPFRIYVFCYFVNRHGYLQIFRVSAHAAMARGALEVDVLVHALDMADGGVDARGDGFDLHSNGVQTAVQRGETLPCPVLVVPEGDVCCPFILEHVWEVLHVRLPGVIAQVVHVLLVFIHENGCIVQLHLQVHHLDKTNVFFKEHCYRKPLVYNGGDPQHPFTVSTANHAPAASGRRTSRWTWRSSADPLRGCFGASACFVRCCWCWTSWRSAPGCSSASRPSSSGGPESPRRLSSARHRSTCCCGETKTSRNVKSPPLRWSLKNSRGC